MHNNNLDRLGFNGVLTDEDLYWLAKKRLGIKRAFLTHFGVYCVCNAVFIGMSILGGSFWAIWPILGWGIGIGIHLVTTVIRLSIDYNSDYVLKEMDYLRKNFNQNNNTQI